MKAIILSKTSVNIYNMTRRRVEDAFNNYKHNCNNLKCRKTTLIVSVL
jgi:hypothetical protein